MSDFIRTFWRDFHHCVLAPFKSTDGGGRGGWEGGGDGGGGCFRFRHCSWPWVCLDGWWCWACCCLLSEWSSWAAGWSGWCLRMCPLSLSRAVNEDWQLWHRYGRSPVWRNMWRTRELLWRKLRGQCSQKWFFSSAWICNWRHVLLSERIITFYLLMQVSRGHQITESRLIILLPNQNLLYSRKKNKNLYYWLQSLLQIINNYL